MATWDKDRLRTRVLQYLNVLGAGQESSADDAQVTDEAIDSAHAELRTLGLAPFETSAIPEYAQLPMRDYVGGQLAAVFGLSDARRAEFVQNREFAKKVLRQQLFQYYPLAVDFTDY